MEEGDQGAEREDRRLGQRYHRGVVGSAGCRHVQTGAIGSPNPCRGEGWNNRHTSAHKRRPAFAGGPGQDYG